MMVGLVTWHFDVLTQHTVEMASDSRSGVTWHAAVQILGEPTRSNKLKFRQLSEGSRQL